MDEQRQKAYFNLIQQVLSCPNGQELAVLRSHEDLVDADFVQVMGEIATQMVIDGQQGAADFLLELADRLRRAFCISEEYLNFLLMVLKVTYENDNNPQVVYLLLQTRLEQLNETFAQVLQDWANSTFQTEQSIEKQYKLASIIVNFSNLIQNFSLGNRANNLEIAIKGFEVVYQVFNFDAFPKEWAIVQTNLGNAYRDRLRGNRSKNLEQSIDCHMQAFLVFKREIFPEEWAATQNNLAATYGKRIIGDREQNLEDAIDAIESALQIYTREVFPKDWAMAQNNLGLAYSDRIKGDRAKNLKKAIAVFQDALQVRTLETCPQDWAMTQNNLGVAYYNLVDDYRSENLERAIESYLNALQVRTYEAFPQDWAETHINLGNAYMDRIIGEQEQNLKWAIKSFEKALQVYNRDIFPERWALVHNNLGNVSRYQGQIDKAIKYFRSALEIRTPTAFPLECLMSGNNLGTTAFDAELWSDAIEGYKLAQEAVETSRESASTSWRASEILQDAMIVYVNIVQAYINVGQLEKALETVERSKARNLVDLIATRNLCPKGDIPETVLNQLKYLYREIDIEQRRLEIKQSNSLDNVSERLVKSNLETTSIGSIISDRAKLNQLRQQLDELISIYITPVDPTFSITQKVNPISYSEIQALMKENTALIEWYFIGDIFLNFIIASQGSRPIIWKSSKEDFKDLMDLGKAYMRAYLEKKDEWEQALSNSLKSLAQILHINDILKHIPPNIKQLVIIPHRYLHLFPLHALEGKRENAAGDEELYAATRCLIDLFSNGVKYAPSCQLLQQVQAKHRPNFNKLFALQNPTKDLAYADLEVLAIQPYFRSSHILVKDEASKANFDCNEHSKDFLRTAQCIHFSSHGYFNFEKPLLSALMLANCYIPTPKEPDPNYHMLLKDGRTIDLKTCLTLADLFALDLSQCRLVTISACETGLSDFTSLSDEYIGLPSGFLLAGAASVVSSLWTVSDLSTAFLMTKLYENLQNQTSVAIALNQAQLWLRDITKAELKAWITANSLPLDPTMRHDLNKKLHKLQDDQKPFQDPFHWAAFCAIGQ